MAATVNIPVKNISCESCEKVIGRIISKFEGAKVEGISADAKSLSIYCEQGDLKAIKKALSDYDYLDDGHSASHIMHFCRGVFSGADAFKAENIFLSRLVIVFAVLFAALALFQLFVFNNFEVGKKLWPLLALVPLGIVLNMASLWHARLLGKQFLCNTGMMIGMTIGMMSGFMLGVYVGATNGMFVGSVAGMIVGMALGFAAGRAVGIMGVMEGMMAGMMGGLMGPMLSVMLITDNLVPFLYIFFAACTAIIAGLSYMIYKEAGPLADENIVPSTITLLFAGLLVEILVVVLAVFGPKSVIAWGAI